jgi:SAM-dependent methyltransferase
MPLPAGATAINLGCGLSAAPDWINIDNSPNARLSKYPLLKRLLWKLGVLSNPHYNVPWSRSIEVHDLKKPLPYADSSIDYVYTSHFLEHLSHDDGQKLIGEVFRVLKPRGLVRVVVPDLAIGARHYVGHDAIESERCESRARVPELAATEQNRRARPTPVDVRRAVADGHLERMRIHQRGCVRV